jgi:hypothetical protein
MSVTTKSLSERIWIILEVLDKNWLLAGLLFARLTFSNFVSLHQSVS